MILKGKAKIEFEKWYKKKYPIEKPKSYNDGLHNKSFLPLNRFYCLSIEFTYGVYIAFFDWEEIYISILSDCQTTGFQIENIGLFDEVVWLEGKENVIIKSIETANIIFNDAELMFPCPNCDEYWLGVENNSCQCGSTLNQKK